MKKVSKAMASAGAAGIVCGIISIVSGVSVGVLMIVHGGRMLAFRGELDV